MDKTSSDPSSGEMTRADLLQWKEAGFDDRFFQRHDRLHESEFVKFYTAESLDDLQVIASKVRAIVKHAAAANKPKAADAKKRASSVPKAKSKGKGK